MLGVRAVCEKFNDGEKSEAEQKQLSSIRKKAFLKLGLPLAYINYGEYYGFSIDEINAYIENGRNVVLIINDIETIKDLKNIYGNSCLSCYIHKDLPKLSYFMELAKQRGLSEEFAINRFDKSKKDYDEVINNINVFDYTILNTKDGTDMLELQFEHILQTPLLKKEQTGKYIPKIFIFSGTPGSGKDAALDVISVSGPLHSVIMPKMTSRKRRIDDGIELICSDDDNYNLDSCDIQYENFGNIYGINTAVLKSGLNDGISFSVSISDLPTINKLKKMFPNHVVPIYIQGQKYEEFAKLNQYDNSEYMIKHLESYDDAFQSNCSHITDYDHVILYNGNLTDLAKQIVGIIKSYEFERDLSNNLYKEYIGKAQKYINYAQTHEIELT